MRTATRQVCRRHGYLASFMCRPGLDGFYPSGWHLHQSLQDRSSGTNLFAAGKGKKALSGIGNNWLAGLMGHAVETVVFATPTINGYGRFMPNSLAPDRVSWGIDHRGTMFRVLFGVNEQATRLENRSGEPAANPYLFIASQIAAGLDGIQRQLVLPTAETDPYKSDNTRLPDSLEVALDAAVCSELCQDQFGSVFMQYYQKLKQAELQRYNHFLSEHDGEINADEVTPWEQDEYFDFF
jgi:glutamine synthetase